jgi:hypothetical protein
MPPLSELQLDEHQCGLNKESLTEATLMLEQLHVQLDYLIQLHASE